MEFFNIGGGEILVIVLLALILFGPEDIMRMMRTLGKYTRAARDMWNQFSGTIQQEYMASEELNEAIEETKASVAEAENALKTIKSSVGEISTSVKEDVSEARDAVKTEAAESAKALKAKPRVTVPAVSGWQTPTPRQSPSEAEEDAPQEAVPQTALPQKAEPEEVLSEETLPEDDGPEAVDLELEGEATEELASGDPVVEGNVPEDVELQEVEQVE